MHNNKFIISISGDGECGKDLAASIFSKYLGINYMHSTSYAVVDHWWAEIQSDMWSKDYFKPGGTESLIIEKDYYKNKEEFYEDRRNRRHDWVTYIHYYNNIDGSNIKLYKDSIIYGNQILTGIRRRQQFIDCLTLIDYAVWMIRPGNKIDKTSEYGPELCDAILINDGTIFDLEHKIKNMCGDIKKEFRL